MSTKWREVAPSSGPRSRAVVAVIGMLGSVWLGWPVWSSFTAPDRDAVRHLTPYLLAALTGLLVLLAWALWRDAGRRTAVLAPILLIATADAGVRIFLSPGASGIEPVFALPLLAGVALGGPAGFLTGALACLGS
ncbi:MAG: hypothetical protein GX596_03250, partial [Propionibacterium sp.]|nr:hypothetical protein [Propionibacterium sp.]